VGEEERPGSGLEGARTALSPSLAATAAVLPLVARPRALKFSKELNKRWQEACAALSKAWSNGHQWEADSLRASIFALFNVALETGDADCLHLAEALASTADRLDTGQPSARLMAALTATLESLNETGGLEHPTFASRARHFADRLATCLAPSAKPGERSDVLDRLFANDTRESLERMHEAANALPIDAYLLRAESQELAQQAEQIDLWGIVHLCRQLENYVIQLDEAGEAEQDRARVEIERLLQLISDALTLLDL
jgi:hypothetical protein